MPSETEGPGTDPLSLWEGERWQPLEWKMTFECVLSCVRLFATPWSVAPQAPLSMGFSRQESWSGWPFPPPGDLPNPGIKPHPLHLSPALAGGFFTTSATREVFTDSFLRFQMVLSMVIRMWSLFNWYHEYNPLAKGKQTCLLPRD